MRALCALALLLAACKPPEAEHRSFPAAGPWLPYWGGSVPSEEEIQKIASTFRVIVLNADPDVESWTKEQILTLQAGGKNRVLSYLNIGSCEEWVTQWSTVPEGLLSCSANTAAQLGRYEGYPDEVWMNPGNADHQRMLLDFVAPRLAQLPIDGFILDNLELVEHGTQTTNGPCDAECAQGGLDLVRMLRERFPDFLIVMNHATGDFARLGNSNGISFPTLIDGVNQEGTYLPTYQPSIEGELEAWRDMKMTRGGTPFWISTVDYAGSCDEVDTARGVFERSRAKGFSPAVTNSAMSAAVICYWPF